MPEPDMTEDAPPIVEQALDAVDHMDPDDWIACALADEVRSLRHQLADARHNVSNARRIANRECAIEVLKAVGADATRDWGDAINAITGIALDRRYLKSQAQYVLEMANAAVPVLVADPLDCTSLCYEGPCDCSGEKVERAWDLDPAKVRDAMTGRVDALMIPWDNLLNTVVLMKRDRDMTRDQLSEQNHVLVELFGLAAPEEVVDIMAKVYVTLARDGARPTVTRKQLREAIEKVLQDKEKGNDERSE